MFQVAIILHLLESIGFNVPRAKLTAHHVKLGFKVFEWLVKLVVGIFALLWILALIVIKHLLKVIWEFK